MGESITCPICKVQCVPERDELDDWKCLDCGRVWYYTGHPEAPIASKGRKVRLTKMPEEGDNLNEIIKPL